VLPGSVTVRHTRCGKPACHCAADPPVLQGPYLSWTRKVAGKTVTHRLDAQQLADYRPWLDNARRLRQLLGELERLSLDIVEGELRSLGHPAGLTARRRKTPAT